MSYDQLVRLYFDRSNALQWYWTLYVVIIGGLLAFSSLRQRGDPLTALLVIVLYCMFAYKNLGAIRESTEQRLATLEAIKHYPVETAEVSHARANIEPTLHPPAYEGVRNFHVASDVLTVAALCAMELRRQRHARADREATDLPRRS